MTHPLDALLARQFPVVVAPRFAVFEPLSTPGDRFVVTEQGLLLETRRAWIHAVTPVQGGPLLRPVPYGPGPAMGATLLCGPIPKALRARFIDEARAALPSEHAAWFTWHEATGEFAYREVRVLEHTPARIRYERPELAEGEHLVVDVHSHGRFGAGLSATDELDDRGALQLSLVYGNLDRERPSTACVLRCLGVTLPRSAINFGG